METILSIAGKPGPVSYTHLDVYKRQVLFYSSSLLFLFYNFFPWYKNVLKLNTNHYSLPNGNTNALIPVSRCGNGIAEAVEPDAGVHNHASVSYTHLRKLLDIINNKE